MYIYHNDNIKIKMMTMIMIMMIPSTSLEHSKGKSRNWELFTRATFGNIRQYSSDMFGSFEIILLHCRLQTIRG